MGLDDRLLLSDTDGVLLALAPAVTLLVALAVMVVLPVTVVVGVPEPVWVAEFVVVGVGVCEGVLLPVGVPDSGAAAELVGVTAPDGVSMLLCESVGVRDKGGEVKGVCEDTCETDCVDEPVGVAEGVPEDVGVLPSSVGLRDAVTVPVCERVLVRLAEGVGVGVGAMHDTRVTAPAAPAARPDTDVPKPMAVVLVTWRGLA